LISIGYFSVGPKCLFTNEVKKMDYKKAYPYLKALLDASIEAAPGVVKAPAKFISSLAEQLNEQSKEEIKQLEQEIKGITKDELAAMIKEAGCSQKESIEFIVEAVGVIPEFSQKMDYRLDKVDMALEEITNLLKLNLVHLSLHQLL